MARSVKEGEWYRHKDTPNYAWARVVRVLEPGQYPNDTRKKVAKCEWVVNKTDLPFMIKYIAVSNLIKAN